MFVSERHGPNRLMVPTLSIKFMIVSSYLPELLLARILPNTEFASLKLSYPQFMTFSGYACRFI